MPADPTVLASVLARTDFLFMSRAGAEAAGARLGAAPRGRRITVTTLGADGAAAEIEDRTVAISGIRVTPADTTGAGDAFAAAFLHAHYGGADAADALAFANAAAALSTMRVGAQSGLPTEVEVRPCSRGPRIPRMLTVVSPWGLASRHRPATALSRHPRDLRDIVDEGVLGASNHVALALPLIARIAADGGDADLAFGAAAETAASSPRPAAPPPQSSATRSTGCWPASLTCRGARAGLLADERWPGHEARADAKRSRPSRRGARAVTAPLVFDYSSTVADIIAALARRGGLRLIVIPRAGR